MIELLRTFLKEEPTAMLLGTFRFNYEDELSLKCSLRQVKPKITCHTNLVSWMVNKGNSESFGNNSGYGLKFVVVLRSAAEVPQLRNNLQQWWVFPSVYSYFN